MTALPLGTKDDSTLTMRALRERVRRLRERSEAARDQARRRGWTDSAATFESLARDLNALENELVLTKEGTIR